MAGLLSILQSNYQALNSNSQALALTGKNLNNINNPGYARQSVILGSLGMVNTPQGMQSMGVGVMGIAQARDALLDKQVQSAISATSDLTAAQTGLQAAQTALGEQIDRTTDSSAVGANNGASGTGINKALSTLFSGFQSYSVNPSNPGQQQLLLQNASILVDSINTADSQLASVQTNLTAQATADVTKSNDILTEISNLNTAIGSAENGKPGSALDLRDQRQSKIEELAQYMNFSVQDIPDNSGRVSLTATDTTGAAVALINPTLTAPLTFDGTHFFAGNPAKQLTLTGGSLQAEIDVRDGTVADTRTQIKAMADQLTISVNAAYNPASTAGKNFFSAVPSSGLIQLEATTATLRATATGTAGGNDLALAAASVANTNFTTAGGDLINGTLSTHYSGVVANLGLALSNTTNRLADQTLTKTNAVNNRDSVSGVSQDEELTNMLQYQRGYQACARFTNIIDSLLGSIVTSLGTN